MSDEMRVLPFDRLLRWIQVELKESGSIFGIPRSLFYAPQKERPYATELFGQPLATPVGPAAGPHTQLAQNIVSAWLSGGRFIELKTVQIMDELEIPRPCIDLADEGYNVEWSQELRLEESAGEYVKAWVLVHLLPRLLGFERGAPLGTIFNLSVGYNLEGIQSPPMTRFMDRLADAGSEIAEIRSFLRREARELADVEIPARITDNVTLSTMHGCPPDEIERIARYLLEERNLHTTVKLNPTLLGKERVLSVLHDDLGFREIDVPNRVFEHDLSYGRAVDLVRSLQAVAAARSLVFGVKLSNTLALRNHRGVLPGDEMYMSGRALYPVTMTLFHKLVEEFEGDLRVSFSAGADPGNVPTILSCGALPVTMASDLLKPGGYSRFVQALENLETEMRARGAGSLEDLAVDRLANLERAAAEARGDRRYQKAYHSYGLPKVHSGLGLFDCVAAPCVEACAVCQDVPEYAWLVAKAEDDRALEAVLSRNPFPGVTGHVCPHLCETRCTRNNYDEPVGIRALKRFAVESGRRGYRRGVTTGRRVAVIGSGPSGLAAATFLALSGVDVTVYETKDVPGGMVSLAPGFRLPRSVVEEDIARIRGLGVKLLLSHPVSVPPEILLQEGYHAVYAATGFPRDARLEIEGIEGEGVLSALDLLGRVARGERPDLGQTVLVIGGGNTAMDAARTAQRLAAVPVTVLYRRTRPEMPAQAEEVADLLEEGNRLLELVSPVRVVRVGRRLVALECARNELGAPGPDGRRKPAPVAGSEFQIPADSVIVAVGQAAEIAFLDGSRVSVRRDGSIAAEVGTGATVADGVYAGGDAVRGPATIVEACADGRRAAEAICARLGVPFLPPPSSPAALSVADVLEVKRARVRISVRCEPEKLAIDRRQGFDLVERTLSSEEARREAARCLQCSTLCDKCVEVCPNRANVAYAVARVDWRLPVLSVAKGALAVTGEEEFVVRQTRQIVHVDDLCNECGNCATFCVHEGKPYREKPRLFFDPEVFAREEENAFFIEEETIRRRERGQEMRLSAEKGRRVFETPAVRLVLSPAFGVVEATLKRPFVGSLSLREAAEMAVLLEGITSSAPFLVR
jgi:putative selenate reductase